MLLQDLLKNVTLLYNEYLTIANDTSVYEDTEYYIFYCGDCDTEAELLERIGLACPHLLTREVTSMTANQKYINEYDSCFCCLESVVSL